MIGAIIGDIVGSKYEWTPMKTKKFPMFEKDKRFTDDSVLTCAIADALLYVSDYTEENVKNAFVDSIVKFCWKYRDAGYGGNFNVWLYSRNHKPYGSYGNGSAMRVSPVGWLFETLDETRKVARWSAEITHNHPEGIKGAEAVASVIYLARTGSDKEEIKAYVEEHFYKLDFTCDEIRDDYLFHESCQETVPQAIEAFLEGEDFEDVIRTAISLGGDSDTLTCIAGSMGEAFYGVPAKFKKELPFYLTDDLEKTVEAFYQKLDGKEITRHHIENTNSRKRPSAGIDLSRYMIKLRNFVERMKSK